MKNKDYDLLKVRGAFAELSFLKLNPQAKFGNENSIYDFSFHNIDYEIKSFSKV